MLPDERRRHICDLLASGQVVRVSELSERLSVSEMTVRRDLKELAASGVVKRIPGGAIARLARAPFEQRTVERRIPKKAIAHAVAQLIQPGEAVGLDTGTTTFFVAQELAQRRDLSVITNSINAAIELSAAPGLSVLLIGGFVRGRAELSLVGPVALDTIRRFRVDTLVLGVGGIDPERGLVYFDLEEVDVRRAMLDSARRVIVAADHTKFGVQQMATLGPLDQIDIVVTDKAPTGPTAAALAAADVEVIVAPGTGGSSIA